MLCAGLGFLALAAVIYFLAVLSSRPGGPLASGKLPNGRILQIEGVTFGTYNQIGKRSLVESIAPWLPYRVVQLFEPKNPHQDITLEKPGLVVWVNAIDPKTHKHVDCQGLRMEFIDENGELIGEETPYWFNGGNNFWRVGHAFKVFPRSQRTLTLQVTSWRSTNSIRFELRNPHVMKPADWSARPLPQRVSVGNLEVELNRLVLRTNGGPKQYWTTPSRYWEPVWRLRRDNDEVSGWDEPDWSAADPTGNQGKFLSTHQPALRFSAEFYPSATNLADSILLGHLPEVDLANLQSNAWRDLVVTNGSTQLAVLRLCPPGVYVFVGGNFDTNPAAPRLGATKGGAPSGWVGTVRRVSPVQTKFWHGHYTPVPTVYIRAPAMGSKERLGIRLRDEQGRYWLAKAEPEGAADNVWPFLLETPPDVKKVSGEVVLLKPVQAEFTVKPPTPDGQ
jgi:hypothetical protein